MLKIPELAMPKSRKVSTVCNIKREMWADREEAQKYRLYVNYNRFGAVSTALQGNCNNL